MLSIGLCLQCPKNFKSAFKVLKNVLKVLKINYKTLHAEITNKNIFYKV